MPPASCSKLIRAIHPNPCIHTLTDPSTKPAPKPASKAAPKVPPRTSPRVVPVSPPPPTPRQPKPTRKAQTASSQNAKKLITPSLAGALAIAVVFGYLAAVTFVSPSDPAGTPTDPLCSPHPEDHTHAPTGRPTSLSGLSAAEFDRDLDREEGKTGVTALRERLAGRATGHVLELAVGTGRNFGYYDWASLAPGAEEDKGNEKGARMLSFTGVDIASDMLEVAASKLKAVPSLKAAEPTVTVLRDQKGEVVAGAISFLPTAIRLVKSDALSFLPPPPPTRPAEPAPADGRYDTIIQTFGLCSVTSPRTVLSNLAPLLRPETGRILLLEHGRGTWGIVNWWLDRRAPGHFTRYGCWWNRDLEGIVREACREKISGKKMEVVSVERPGWQGGTVLWIELKVVEE